MTLGSKYDADTDGAEPDLTFDGPLPDWVFGEATGFPFHTAHRVFGGLEQMIHDLLYGKLRAFGDPLRSGARPEWIPPRLWHHLKMDRNDPYKFTGGGSTYWHVKVGSVTEFFSWVRSDVPTFIGSSTTSNSDGDATEAPWPTKEEIEALYKQRVAEAIKNGDRFNRNEDADWGKKHGVNNRTRIRELRRVHAPEDWKKRVSAARQR